MSNRGCHGSSVELIKSRVGLVEFSTIWGSSGNEQIREMTWNTLAKLVVLKFAMCHGCFDDMLGHIVLAAKSGCCFFSSSFRTIVPQHPRLKIYSIEGSAVTNQYLSFFKGLRKCLALLQTCKTVLASLEASSSRGHERATPCPWNGLRYTISTKMSQWVMYGTQADWA